MRPHRHRDGCSFSMGLIASCVRVAKPRIRYSTRDLRTAATDVGDRWITSLCLPRRSKFVYPSRQLETFSFRTSKAMSNSLNASSIFHSRATFALLKNYLAKDFRNSQWESRDVSWIAKENCFHSFSLSPPLHFDTDKWPGRRAATIEKRKDGVLQYLWQQATFFLPWSEKRSLWADWFRARLQRHEKYCSFSSSSLSLPLSVSGQKVMLMMFAGGTNFAVWHFQRRADRKLLFSRSRKHSSFSLWLTPISPFWKWPDRCVKEKRILSLNRYKEPILLFLPRIFGRLHSRN